MTTRKIERVPFVALERQHAALAHDLRAAMDRVLGSNGFILGAEVDEFERDFADYCGVAHCVGVASGTAALTLSLLAAGIGPGDEVIVPAHTFIASALAVVHAGATPVFCDVQDGGGLIDPISAAAAIGTRTAAIVAVHLYGQACDMDAIGALAARHGLLVVEDAAQAHGAGLRERRVGSLGAIAAFSFYPSKNLGALGDGGAVCTDDATLAAKVRELRHLGQRSKGRHVSAGFNERLDGLQAAFLRVKLRHLDGWNAARRGHAARYRELLRDSGLRLAEEVAGTTSVHHLFAVRSARRDELAAALASAGIDTGVHYAPAVHEHEALAGLGGASRPVALTTSERWARDQLSLPMFAELRPDELERVAAACDAFE